jgi:hypothetical protein
LTVVREDVTSKTEVAFTRNLVWEPVPVSGRRVRITQEDADRFEEIQARRVFGDAEVGYFAVVNPLYPDAGNPSVIAREWTGGEGVHHSECYGPDRKWISTETITYVRNRYHDGMLEPVTEETAARLIEAWTPRPRDVRCFACLEEAGDVSGIPRVWDDKGRSHEEGFDHNSDWVGAYKVLSCKRLLSRVARRAE